MFKIPTVKRNTVQNSTVRITTVKIPSASVGQHNAYKLENTVDFTINADIFGGMNKAYINIFLLMINADRQYSKE